MQAPLGFRCSAAPQLRKLRLRRLFVVLFKEPPSSTPAPLRMTKSADGFRPYIAVYRRRQKRLWPFLVSSVLFPCLPTRRIGMLRDDSAPYGFAFRNCCKRNYRSKDNGQFQKAEFRRARRCTNACSHSGSIPQGGNHNGPALLAFLTLREKFSLCALLIFLLPYGTMCSTSRKTPAGSETRREIT